jgi:hypothetical protein
MKSILFVLVSAAAFAMSAPSSAQVYDPMPPPSVFGGVDRGNDFGASRRDNWRDPRDWRQNRNDWREGSPDNWRRSRNDWKDADDWRPSYPVGEEEAKAREREKIRAYDDAEEDETPRIKKDDDYSADCSAANPWRGGSSSAPCR